MANIKQITGGSRDVNPQFFGMQTTQSAADTTTSSDLTVPITRIPGGKQVTIIELLKIFWVTTELPPGVGAAASTDTIRCSLSSVNTGTTILAYEDGRLIARRTKISVMAFTAAGTFFAYTDEPLITDLTDGAGHGVLFAADRISLQVNSTGTGVANQCNIKVLYRFKRVGLAEYIGIVQSQQG